MKIVNTIIVLILLALFVSSCTIGSAIQIKNLKDEMRGVKERLDSLQTQVDSLKVKVKK